jgi:outer membrane protein assembly factor BamA
MQSALGGSHLLRGFHSLRFRDEKLLGGSAEYRFEVVPKVELAAFYDIGNVLGDMRDFDFATWFTPGGSACA